MAKKKNTFCKFLAFTTTVAAIGGTCYVFRDKIKQSSLYKITVEKCSDLINYVSAKFGFVDDDDFFFDDDLEDDDDFETVFSENNEHGREYTSITINEKTTEPDIETNDSSSVTDISATNETNTDESITDETITDETITSDITDNSETTSDESEDDTIPTISFETVTGYENEGLSDVSEDPDVLEDQDRLDF